MDNHPAEKLAWIQLIMAMILPKLKMIKNTDMGEYDLIYRIIDYLSSHYTEHVTLDDLAKELRVNKYYLSHTFWSKLNSGFPDYLNRLRCDHAQMLLSPRMNISQPWGNYPDLKPSEPLTGCLSCIPE